MANKPQDPKLTPNHAAAVDDVRTKQEVQAAETKRKAEADLASAHQGKAEPSPHAKSHPKLHRSEETGPIEETSIEPVVEDEP
jgi:hypothetical protein